MTQFNSISIPIGSEVTVKRKSGIEEKYVFKGTDQNGGFYEDANGQRHKDVGEYTDIKIGDTPWKHGTP